MFSAAFSFCDKIMEIRYTRDRRDYPRLFAHYRRMFIAQPSLFWPAAVLLVSVLSLVAKFAVDIAWRHSSIHWRLLWYDDHHSFPIAIIFGLAGGIGGSFFGWLLYSKRSFSVSINYEGIREIGPGYNLHVEWSKIKSIFNEPQAVYFYPTKPLVANNLKQSFLTSQIGSEIFIPKRVFSSVVESERFAQTALHYWHQAKNGLPVSINPQDIWPPAPSCEV